MMFSIGLIKYLLMTPGVGLLLVGIGYKNWQNALFDLLLTPVLFGLGLLIEKSMKNHLERKLTKLEHR
ncbi:MAG TPA: hypothetical protein VOA64_08965 [Candidatus Dormibacteraeota bacterium]|nr:hypothetical protein [Candidatus Dormibacteraeota bacterium]